MMQPTLTSLPGFAPTSMRPPRGNRVQWPVVAAAAAIAAILAYGVEVAAARNGVALFAIGLALGVVLFQAAFGFTSAWRVFLADGRSAGLRAQLIMLGVACMLFYPALGIGALFGHPVSGSVAPLNVSLVVGAFLFGVGMQLGGGCASGTLFAVGGGSAGMLPTLLFFIIGSTVGLAHQPFWTSLPGLPAVSLIRQFGWPAALASNLLVFGLLALVLARAERRRFGSVAPIAAGGHLLRGPWPLAAGAVALAILNFATLALAGRPWGITSAFGLWGAKLLAAGHVDIGGWGGWAAPGPRMSISQPLLSDINSVMDFGIMLGALLAAGLSGRFVLLQKLTIRRVAASAIGGLLLGYGARLGYGCNIGAFFDGVASGSLHGWVWIACAMAGTVVGIRLRPLFGLIVEHRLTAC